MVIQQEVEIGRLREELAAESMARKKCQDNRRREGNFLETVINQCKGDNVPLTETSCTDFCRQNQVQVPVCAALCQTEVTPCSYWHRDTVKDPIVSFEEVTNRTRRENTKTEKWLNRLEAYRELRTTRDTEDVTRGGSGAWEGAGREVDSVFGTYMQTWDMEDSQDTSVQQPYQLILPSNETECHQLSCVTHPNYNTVACLDFNLIDKSANFFRLQSGWRMTITNTQVALTFFTVCTNPFDKTFCRCV